MKLLRSSPWLLFRDLVLPLFLAMAFFRLAMVSPKGWGVAWKDGLVYGLLNDALMSAIPLTFSLLLLAVGPRWISRWISVLGYSLTTLFLLTATMVSSVYTLFFDSKLYWWVVRYHWTDAFTMDGSQKAVSLNLWFFTASVFSLVALFIGAKSLFRRHHVPLKINIPFAFVLLGAVLWLQQYPLQLEHDGASRLIGGNPRLFKVRPPALEHPVLAWFTGIFESHDANRAIDAFTMSAEERKNPSLYLSALAQNEWGKTHTAPILHAFDFEPEVRRAWLEELGLDPRKKPNIVVLFVESLKAYELLHPVWGPKLFPHTRRLMENSIFFRQSYSNSWTAGPTVRSVFSVHCGFLENILGPATIIANSRTRLHCLQEKLAQSGYQTHWASAAPTSFHYKGRFEADKGTQHIHEPSDYIPLEGQNPEDPLGVLDRYYYRGLIRVLDEAALNSPFYLHTINVQTHFPWAHPGDLKLDPMFQGQGFHTNYLGTLANWDLEFHKFLTEILTRKWADNTIFVLMGDHSVPVSTPNAAKLSHVEQRFRVPVLFFSKSLRRARRVDWPISQMDIGPTLAMLAGVTDKPSTFLGRALDFRRANSTPWFFSEDSGKIYFRKLDQWCEGPEPIKCYRVLEGQDPMYSDLKSGPQVKAQEFVWLRKVMESSFIALGRDMVIGRPSGEF
jgi:arylsulfatase A-like enzyme